MLQFIAQYWLEALFGILLAGLTMLVRGLRNKVEISHKATKEVQVGIKCMLRDRIIQTHEHYLPLGYCPMFIRENMEDIHSAYKALGGNGAISHIVKELEELPTFKEV